MTASSVASAKIGREQLEQLARTLRLELRVGESGAALFRRCLERASELATLATLDRLDRATGRARFVQIEVESDTVAGAMSALEAVTGALGGSGEEATAAREGTPAEHDAC